MDVLNKLALGRGILLGLFFAVLALLIIFKKLSNK